VLNCKKLYRLYREERLTVRKRGGRKRALGTRAPMAIPQGRNQRWSLDFVADTLASGRKFRMLTVVDDFSRECVALVVDNSLTGIRVARELDRFWRCGAHRAWWSATTAPSSPHAPSWPGRKNGAWNGTTSHLANRPRTASSRASTAGCATSASTSISSPTLPEARDGSSKNGGPTTTPHRPHTSLNGLTPTEFAARPNQGHNQNRLSL
jgi:putative transposase